jgi:hypothetical protein
MNVKLVILKPGEHWLSDKPAEDGYWGFVRCKKDYEDEKSTLRKEFEELIGDLKKEGRNIELLPGILEIKREDDAIENFRKLKTPDVDVNIIFAVEGFPDLDIIVAGSKNVIFFDKFKPNIYWGTLFLPPYYQELKSKGNAKNVFLVEGNWEKLKSILRGI